MNADALLEILTNDGGDIVTTGAARYRVLYLGGSSRRMTLPVLRKLASLVDGGATVVGHKPESDPGLSTGTAEFAALTARLWPATGTAQVGKGRVLASSDIDATLASLGIVPDFDFAGQADSEVVYLHRKSAQLESYFVNNRRDRAEQGDLRLRVTGKVPELFQPETGEIRPLSYRIEGGETIVPLNLAPDEAIHIVLRKAATQSSLTIRPPEMTEVAALDGPWNVAFEAGRGAPASATLTQLAPLDTQADPGIKYFSGIATYTRDFHVPKGWRVGSPLVLDLGEAREVVEVIVNGKPAGYAWNAPYRVDVSAQARPGRNRLEVCVANLWVNRMIGDKQPGAEKITWVTSASYSAKAPLRRSGLIGPVRLLGKPERR